jgi:hypothetical protein
VADNTASYHPDLDLNGGVYVSQGHNLIGNPGDAGAYLVSSDLVNVSAKLGPLQNNGGPTQTMAPLPGSPAIGAGALVALSSLSAAVIASATQLTVTSALPFAPGMLLSIDSEVVNVVGRNLTANTLTVQRGVNGTTAAAHTSGAGLFLATDQRGPGYPRVVNGGVDIGAVEVGTTSQTANAYRIAAASTTPTAGANDQFTLTLVDQFGNTVTSFSGDKTLTFSGLGTSAAGNVPTVTNKSGTAVNEATSELITFTNGVASAGGLLVATKAETATLAVTDGTLSSSSTGGGGGVSLTVSASTASAYRITAASTTPTAGANDQLTLALADQFGNTVSGFSGDKTLIFSGLGTSAAGNAPTVTNKSGTAVNQGTSELITFTNGVSTAGGILVAKKAEAATLAVTDGTLSSTSTGGAGVSLTASPATANAYRIAAASTTPTAGANDQLTLTLADQFGNTVTGFSGDKPLTFSGLGTSAAGNAPTVTDKTSTAVNEGTSELITFTNGVSTAGGNLVAKKAETATLAVTDGTFSSTSTGGTGVSLSVSAAAASKLVFGQQPTNATAGVAISPAVTVNVEDAFGNVVTTDNSTVTLMLNGGTFAGGSTTATATASNGVVTFSNLVINTAGSGYTLTASDGALTPATSSSFTISAAAASQLVITQQPSTTATAGVPFATQPVVKEEDPFGNVITTDSAHTVTATRGSHGIGILQGSPQTVTLNQGVATFSGLFYDVAEAMNLSFSTNAGAFTTTSNDVVVSPATASQLVITQQPSATATAGVPFTTQPVVKEEDPFGNVITTDSVHTVTSARGNHGTGNLQGSGQTVTFNQGVATFSGLFYNVAEAMNLGFSTNAGSFTTTSSDVLVSPAAASQLVITQQPSATATAGVAFSTQPVVKEEDPFGNVITTDSAHTVTAARGSHGIGILQGALRRSR